ncbi:MAG: phosphatidylinositol kinase [Gammaproteobacteria bacterium RIFCSPHIGHO2_12_FULL_45_9]|nr:MAG: phosphatidylinositol kinase [Gammaproteobacteria bacterium RIFCSPHIGHO2_12_FULL_45_9]
MTKTRFNPYKRVEKIEVYLWGKFVGAAALDPKLAYYVFAYDQSFGRSGIEIAPLHMPLNDNEEVYVFTDLPDETYKRLPAMLADSLPDDFGNALIDRYMADKGIARNQITQLDRLAYMGNRGMGALAFKPAHGPKTTKPTAIEMNTLVTEARKVVKGTLDGDYQTNAALRSIIEVGTSAGGARAKAVIAWNPKTHEIQSGQVETQEGFEHWLLKFDGMGTDKELGISEHYGRIEYAYYLMATHAGIKMTESRLLEENGRAHFMTKRFDREGRSIKHHTQTLCAMNHLDYKKKSTNSYEQLLMTLDELTLPHAAYVEIFRRMIFNIMGRNCDDHSKNFSFLLKEGSDWELAPAYDVTFAHNPKGEWTMQHLMSVNGRYKNFTAKDITKVADRFGVGEAKQIIVDIRETIKRWPTFAKKAGLDETETKRIKKLHLLL